MIIDEFRDAVMGRRYQLVQINQTPLHDGYLEQFVDKDEVHEDGTSSLADLRKYRVAGLGKTKSAFATIDDEGQLESIIFGYGQTTPAENPSHLQGDVRKLLDEDASIPLMGELKATTCYSINSIIKTRPQTGRRLVRPLVRFCPQDAQIATVSPFRSFQEAYPQFDAEALQPWELTALAYGHLRQCKNIVQGFHMGNGALIGNINIGADTDKERKLGKGVTVNYIYPQTLPEADERGAAFKAFSKASRHADMPSDDLQKFMHPWLIARVNKALHAAQRNPAIAEVLKL